MDETNTNLTGDEGIMKDCVESCISILTKVLTAPLGRGYFQNELKSAEVVTSVFKEEDELIKENYRPVSVPSKASKIFKKFNLSFRHF